MTQVIYVIGNDGSGKTTYSTRLLEVLRERGASAHRIHYYQLAIRSAFRSLVESVSSVSERKLGHNEQEAIRSADRNPVGPGKTPAGGARSSLLVGFLFIYQLSMAAELQIRTIFDRSDYLIVDRSFVDDLVSILESFRTRTPKALIRLSQLVFPPGRMVYVSAGPEIEFARIGDVDISQAVHLQKSHRYAEIVGMLEQTRMAIRRLDTTQPLQMTLEDPTKGWE